MEISDVFNVQLSCFHTVLLFLHKTFDSGVIESCF